MTRSVIDPINRIEGHLRIEMEVEDNVVTEAWASGGLFRGMELVLEKREPADAAYISQRICGVCPVSHAHASSFAAEGAYGIAIPNNARIIRNMIEGAQFLHSNILWFYNLTGLDYVNPLNALGADIADTAAIGLQSISESTALIEKLLPDFVFKDTQVADFAGVQNRLKAFAENGQLSIFTGHWFDSGADAGRTEYKLSPELDLIATTHYLEALTIQSYASQISGIMGGKMPHIMTSIPGGTTFVPTSQKLDDIWSRVNAIRDWCVGTLLPDTLAVAPSYIDDFGYGKGVGRYVAWGVFDKKDKSYDTTQESYFTDRYFPGGIIDEKLNLTIPDETKITEYTGSSFYASVTNENPRNGVTDPRWPDGFAGLDGVAIPGSESDGKYTWSKAPRYDGKPYEAGPLSRVLSAYLQGDPYYTAAIPAVLDYLGEKVGMNLDITVLQSTMGRVAARNLETVYVANLMVDWCSELMEAIKGGSEADMADDNATNQYFVEPNQTDGEGAGMWEAPRGALYHYEKITNNKIDKYQIIIPTTWNVGPRDADGVPGPIEQALVGVPVYDMEKPIQALRTVHSFDPCIACAVHITEPKTGKTFKAVTSPWGVR